MKYVGSKNRLAKDLVPIIQNYIDNNKIETYIEPFVGGGNIIDKINCKNKIGYDYNKYLIALWNKLKQDTDWIPDDISKEQYLDVKNNMENKYEDYYVGLIGFCATYNAGWFRGYGGKAHTKQGKIRNYYKEGVNNILKQINNIKDVEFKVSNYIDLPSFNNCLLYCDPPYESSGDKMYKENIIYKDYWNKVREWSKNNIVLCSEYNAPEDFECIWSKKVTTTFDNKSRKNDIEKLFIKIK